LGHVDHNQRSGAEEAHMKGRRTRRLMTQVLAVALSAAALLTVQARMASAHPGETPRHESGVVGCEGYLYFTARTVSARFPVRFDGYSASYERVSWRPYLQWWNGSSWVTINTEAPWYSMWSNYLGMSDYPTQYQTWYPYQPGYYRIMNWYHWSSTGLMHSMASGSCWAG
jgi:hypothetical protein